MAFQDTCPLGKAENTSWSGYDNSFLLACESGICVNFAWHGSICKLAVLFCLVTVLSFLVAIELSEAAAALQCL
jgi:hypothetical protein